MRRVFLLAVALVMAVGRGAAAQALTQVESRDWERASLRWHGLDGADGSSTVDVNALLALRVEREGRSWARRGAVLGALAGGVATYLVIHQGGSTSLCDRSANQDAMGKRECVALTVAGGAAGAGLGALIGARFRRE